jgi:hypothetical protein
MSKPITDNLVLEVIDRGLDTLGASGKKAVWFYLEQDPSFEREKVPENLENFEKALRSLFGLGYNFLDSIFRIDLEKTVGQNLRENGSFPECVSYLRAKPSEAVPKQNGG